MAQSYAPSINTIDYYSSFYTWRQSLAHGATLSATKLARFFKEKFFSFTLRVEPLMAESYQGEYNNLISNALGLSEALLNDFLKYMKTAPR